MSDGLAADISSGVLTRRRWNRRSKSDKDQNDPRLLLLHRIFQTCDVNKDGRLGLDELRVFWNMVASDLTTESFAMICGKCGVDSTKGLHETAFVALVGWLCGSDGLQEDDLLSVLHRMSGMQSLDDDEKTVIHPTDIEPESTDIDVSSLDAQCDAESVFDMEDDIAFALEHQASSSSRVPGIDSGQAMGAALLSLIKPKDDASKQDSTHSPSVSPSISLSQASDVDKKSVIHPTDIEPVSIDIDPPSLDPHCDVESSLIAEGDIAVALGHQAASANRVTGSDSRQAMGAALLSLVKPKDDSPKQYSTPSPSALPSTSLNQVATRTQVKLNHTTFVRPSEWLAMPQDIGHIQDVDNASELADQIEDRLGASTESFEADAMIDNPESDDDIIHNIGPPPGIWEPLTNPNLEDDPQIAASSGDPYGRSENLLKTSPEDDAQAVTSSATLQERLELPPKTELEDGAQVDASSENPRNTLGPPLKNDLEDDTQIVASGRSLDHRLEPMLRNDCQDDTQTSRPSGLVYDKLQPLLPSPGDLEDMQECMRLLKEAVTKSLQGLGSTWSLEVFGSAASGFGIRGCDLDVVLCQHEGAGRYEPCAVLSILERELQSSDEFTVQSTVLNARIPILKLKHGDQEVDLSVNNVQPLLNTHLLKAYASLHPTVSKLGIAVKLWAKEHGVCGAKHGHLSPYSFVLMVIYYLQVHCVPRMMSLQKGGAEDHVFNSEDSALDLVHEYLKSGSGWAPAEGLSLDLLYSGFFVFYSQVFNWGTEVVSVRMGTRLSTDSRASMVAGWKFRSRDCQRLHIEDPFELGRNLRDVLTLENEQLLRLSLHQAAQAVNDAWKTTGDSRTIRQQNQHYQQKMMWLVQQRMWYAMSTRARHTQLPNR